MEILPADEQPKIGSTQQHLPIKSIHDDVIILKDGSVAVVLQTTAVNFDLLSENEQLAVISSFAALLNSLSFSIQIVIRSKRLDISKYLENIRKIENAQTNPLLKLMTKRYRIFVETLTSENEVLDKQFFVVVSVSYLEIGVVNNIEQDFNKALTLLIPRRDNIIKMLGRIGLKANQLTNEKLIRLFYDIYNESPLEQDIRAYIDKTVALKAPIVPPTPEPQKPPGQVKPSPQAEESAKVDRPLRPKIQEQQQQTSPDQPVNPDITPPHFDDLYLKVREADKDLTSYHAPYNQTAAGSDKNRPSTPFVVEELEDN